MPFTLRWGIIGAGHISTCFVKDIILDPKTRGVTDVVHEFAATGSRDVSKAEAFIKKATSELEGFDVSKVKAYGSYDEVFDDPEIDAVYIGTPHTYHHACVKLALSKGKHVLVEKPATINLLEWKDLFKLAQEKNRFLMEAMWTRFLPVALEVEKIIKSGKLGEVRMVHADLSGDFDIENIPTSHRILDPKLGGGALLDLGPYPFVWAMLALYENPLKAASSSDTELSLPSSIVSTMLKTPITNVDAHTSIVLTFKDIFAQALLSCGITINSPNPPLNIRLRGGNIIAQGGGIYRPAELKVQTFDKFGSDKVMKEEITKWEIPAGGGWHYQADEVARCIRDGKIQSDLWGWDKTTAQMELFDTVRKQNDYVFPEGVEQIVSN